MNGNKYTMKLLRADDRVDPVMATNNARRFKASGAVAVFNGVFTTVAPLLKINEEQGNEFIVSAYVSAPKLDTLGNSLLVTATLANDVYVRAFADWALKKGWKKCAMVVTLGAYGDEWRSTFRSYWEKNGGTISADKPANYYAETDFTPQLSAALVSAPEVMLIGGPSPTTALVIEQARSLGYKGAFILIDQANQDYIARMLKGTELMGNLIGVGGPTSLTSPGSAQFARNYTEQYKRMVTWECVLNYTATHALARAITAAGTATDVRKIRASYAKALATPMLGDRYPNEIYGVGPTGRVFVGASVQTITSGKPDPSTVYVWWAKSQKEFDMIKSQTAFKGNEMIWQKH